MRSVLAPQLALEFVGEPLPTLGEAGCFVMPATSVPIVSPAKMEAIAKTYSADLIAEAKPGKIAGIRGYFAHEGKFYVCTGVHGSTEAYGQLILPKRTYHGREAKVVSFRGTHFVIMGGRTCFVVDGGKSRWPR